MTSDPTLRVLLLVVLFTYTAQNMLNASIAPLSRDLDLPEWIIGVAVSAAALAVAMLSQFWGRRSVAWGPRRVTLLGLTCALAAGALFSALVWGRSAGLVGAVLSGAGIVLARGPLFGTAMAAIPPTAQVLIARASPDQASRVAGMATFSGVVNASIMVGSLVSSLLGMWWIQAPVHATPWFVAIALGLAWWALPGEREKGPVVDEDAAVSSPPDSRPSSAAARQSPALPPRVSWTDRRLLPWMAGAFGTFFAAGVVQILAGFVLQDRLHLSAQQAVPATAVMLLVIASGAMVMQLLVVPRLRWAPATLVRTGAGVGLVALLVLTFTWHPVTIGVAAFSIGAGMGTVGPGFTAGGSLAVTAQEQGGAAGILNATGAITWIFAPATATALYGWQPLAPFLLALTLLTVSTATAWTLTSRVAKRPTPQES
ncbi:MFS transporter [Schaalia sp. 19OD2882]|uniref:MFS transporter n=1 Tax=Schaalia sp. 19OD2882 TaxID=2794089 RepID=UPI001C1F127B|nr:MFS transporter [Schaalia sp. 19OD2882]QWW20732.1 MFS transporter [Schaalia sp. 19OD2882]